MNEFKPISGEICSFTYGKCHDKLWNQISGRVWNNIWRNVKNPVDDVLWNHNRQIIKQIKIILTLKK